MDTVQNPHDKLFHEIYSHKEEARSFLENFLPEKLLTHIDFASLDICKDSFIDAELRSYYSDILYTINLNKQTTYVYALFEHKSYPERFIHLQLDVFFRYICNAANVITPKELLSIAQQALDQTGGNAIMTVVEQLHQQGLEQGLEQGLGKGELIGEILFAQRALQDATHTRETLKPQSIEVLQQILATLEFQLAKRHIFG